MSPICSDEINGTEKRKRKINEKNDHMGSSNKAKILQASKFM